MTTPRTVEERIDAFLEIGQTDLPDRTFDALRDDIARTRQRYVIGRWREPSIGSLARLPIAAALVVAVGLAWATLGPGVGPGTPTASPTPTPTIAPSPTTAPGPTLGPQVISNGPMDPGRYMFYYPVTAGADGRVGPLIRITIPANGWTAFANFAVDKNYGPSEAEAGASFVVWRIENRYVDGCLEPGATPAPLVPSPGPGIDALLETLASQDGVTAGPLVAVSVSGFSGKLVELTVAVDIETCANGFYPWLDKWVQGNNEVLRVYAIDVDGFRLTFFARIPERTTASDRAELEAIIDSIEIEP